MRAMRSLKRPAQSMSALVENAPHEVSTTISSDERRMLVAAAKVRTVAPRAEISSAYFWIFLADDGVVGNAGRGHDQGLETCGGRLDLAEFVGADEAESGQAVGFPALAEVFEAGKFVGVGGDDDFAADVVRDGVFAGDPDHGRGAGHAEAGFQ